MFRFDVVGLGQPIIDVLIRLRDDRELESLGLTRGSWQLVDLERWTEVHAFFSRHEIVQAPGCSSANTMCFLGTFGGFESPGAVYVGQCADDAFGARFEEHMQYAGCVHYLMRHPTLPTARALSLISPDGERTMLVCLGASEALHSLPHEFWQFFRQTRHAHFTAFMLASEPMRSVTLEAIRIAKMHGATVSLDIGAPALVKRERDTLLRLLRAWQVDILFANTMEMQALADGQPHEKVLEQLFQAHPHLIVVLKAGDQGSTILTRRDRYPIAVEAADVVDTTGAGDAYAGAFLRGHLSGWSLRRSGIFGSRVAALVVSQVGATLQLSTNILNVIPLDDTGRTIRFGL